MTADRKQAQTRIVQHLLKPLEIVGLVADDGCALGWVEVKAKYTIHVVETARCQKEFHHLTRFRWVQLGLDSELGLRPEYVTKSAIRPEVYD